MRFDSEVKFYKSTELDRYIPGKDNDSTEELVADIMANVTDVGISRSAVDFGEIKSGNKIIRCVHPVGDDWNYCLIDDDPNRYVPVTDVSPLKLQTYMVGREQ